jgi:hypothetical protein
MKTFNQYNESIRDQMTPKSNDELIDVLEETEKLIATGAFIYDDVINIINHIKQIKQIDTQEFIHLLIDEIDIPSDEIIDWMLGISGISPGNEIFDKNIGELLLKVMKK